ncbi:MAG: AAA family ATPase [Candidatus Omnitrophota bacterium]|nr:MAG: AAA family ATPase [Candidatus Omnitrophota bacterium]
MYLKELEIFGFKSFPEKTTLKFEPGVIVVVGPNGCGKSNVFDSIKWALGEQSPKSLRGSKMEDVIFNGTENHLPLNYTEVALTFSNEDRYLPIDYKEVSVSRKLYRSGESNYFINKNVVRLKDVQSLFMGTGIGESTYSFIEQGKIEIFLSYKPEDKRLIFDEASGIIMYKERKKEALRRLKDTDDNLLRLEDILSEVRRQIRYLERQVNKAKRYKEIKEKLLGVEKKIAALKFWSLEDKNNNFAQELKTLSENEENKNKELTEVKEKCEQLNADVRQLRKDLSTASSAVVSLNAQAETSLKHIAVYEQRVKELSERNQDLNQRRASCDERLTLAQRRLSQEQKRLIDIEEVLGSADGQIKELQSQKNRLEKDISQAKKKIKEDKEKILEFETKKVNLTNQQIEIQTNLFSFIKRKKRLSLDKSRLEELLSEKKQLLEEARKQAEDIESNLDALKKKRITLALKEKELAAYKEELKTKLIEREKELIELRACYEFLKDLRTKYDAFSITKKITLVFDEEPININKMVISLKDVEFRKVGDLYKAEIEAKVVSLQEEELEGKITNTQAEIEEIKRMLADLAVQKDKLSQEVSVENKIIVEEERKLSEKLTEKESLNSEWSRLQEELELVEEEVKATVQDIGNFEQKQKDTEGELSGLQEQLEAAHCDLEKCQAIIGTSSEKLREIDIEVVRKEEQKQSFFKEKESLNSKISLFQEEKADILKNIADIDKEKQNNSLRIVSLEEEMEKLNKKMEEDRRQIQECQLQKEKLEEQEGILQQQIEEKAQLANSCEKQLQEARSSIYNKKLDMQSVEYEKEKIRDYLRQVYQIEFDTAAVNVKEVEESLQALVEEKENAQKKMSSLGEVNLIAIEEFEELKKREQFLDNQKQDLIVSKDNLKKAIQKINRTTKEMFLDTFNKVQEEFKRNFRFLFGGGRAQLILLDEDNILESGVEIEVQPPGKKLQNVSLLSGGEKALTAISLIFAIFRVRPSPICVLDEIDAPLDEANVDRFNQLLKEFSSISQFIVITHNKRTMSNADVLYGVTMQEKGVSKVVSVKFAASQAEEEVPA